jgi:hypothetical protein
MKDRWSEQPTTITGRRLLICSLGGGGAAVEIANCARRVGASLITSEGIEERAHRTHPVKYHDSGWSVCPGDCKDCTAAASPPPNAQKEAPLVCRLFQESRS